MVLRVQNISYRYFDFGIKNLLRKFKGFLQIIIFNLSRIGESFKFCVNSKN